MKKIKVHREEGLDYYDKDLYIVICEDKDTFNKVQLGDVEIEISRELSENYLHRYPQTAKVMYANDSAQFKYGDTLICRHTVFYTTTTPPISKGIMTEPDGVMKFKLQNRQIICKVEDGDITELREGIILCERVKGDLISTNLELTGDNKGERRDLVKVVKVYKGSLKVKEGDYLMTALGGDYEVYIGGKTVIAVDEYFGDFVAITDSPEWYENTKEVRKSIDLRKTMKA